MRSYDGIRCLSFVASWILAVAATSAFAADHRDAPLILGNEQQDINDIYAFQSPSNPNNVVFVITVNPFIGMFAEDGTLDPNTVYELLIDTNGDAREDINFAFFFSRPNTSLQQSFILQSGAATLARGVTGQNVAIRGGGTVRVAVHDDPFFFDSNILMGAPDGIDNFAAANITALILEIPRRLLRANNIGVWGITEVQGKQVDRMGRPAINTVLINTARKDAFNVGVPADDVKNFFDEVVAKIMADFNRDMTTAQALANVLLPDILTIDTSSANGFGPEGSPNLNGRKLDDDVIDVELQVLSGNAAASDNVDANDKAFLNTFPYLASPHP